jgi:hypothetical protein
VTGHEKSAAAAYARLRTDEERAAFLFERIRAARRREEMLWALASPPVVAHVAALGLAMSRLEETAAEPAPDPFGDLQ